MLKNNCPKVSVIVVNFKGKKQLRKCLEHLIKTSYPNYDIIVVDCLTPNIKRWMKRLFPKIKLIHYNHDIGASASHNVSATANDSKYLAFIDNDSYVTKNWLTELVKIMETDKKIGAAQAKILLTQNKRYMDHLGLAIDALGTWYTPRGINADRFNSLIEIFAASSAGFIVQKEAFDRVQGFDADYFIYDDDTDFSFRLRLFGYRIVFVPSAIIFHDADPARIFSPKKLFHAFKNRIYTMLKNYQLRNIWWRLALYYLATFAVGVYFLIINRNFEAITLFRSAFLPLKNLKSIWKKRAYVQFYRQISDSELFHRGFLKCDLRATLLDIMSKLKYVKKA